VNWQSFCIQHGAYLRAAELAAIVEQPVKAIVKLREGVGRSGAKKRIPYAEAFALWRGREPRDDEWPAPAHLRANGTGYEWQPPELAFLASLVGRLSKPQICDILTQRLRQRTGDPLAHRNEHAVQSALSRIGLQVGDVVGGLTPSEAGEEIGSSVPVYKAIDRGEIPVARVGKRLVIPRDAWENWKSERALVPAGYVRLRSIRDELAIRSDKLSEFARMGYVPQAIQCNIYGANSEKATQGAWYVPSHVAQALVADRHAGRPMPWHGKPMLDNLRQSYRTWLRKRHKDDCEGCKAIWGPDGPPKTFEDYCARYPALSFGAKRHLTFSFKPSLSIAALAREADCARKTVQLAIDNGVLRATGKPLRISRIDATRWIARKKPHGAGKSSWIAKDTAFKWYGLDRGTVDAAIAAGTLRTQRITNGPKYGEIFVSRQQCRELRDAIGFTVDDVAKKLTLSVERVRDVLQGLDWRGGDRLSPSVVDAIEKRLEAKHSFTVDAVAQRLGKSPEWVRARIEAGLVKTRRARWHPDRQILSARTVAELQSIAEAELPDRIPRDWVYCQGATKIAGVSSGTLNGWVDDGTLPYRETPAGRRYDPAEVMRRAKQHWETGRQRRGGPPAWLASNAASPEASP